MNKNKQITKAWAVVDKDEILSWWDSKDTHLQYDIFFTKSGAVNAQRYWKKSGNKYKVVQVEIHYVLKEKEGK